MGDRVPKATGQQQGATPGINVLPGGVIVSSTPLLTPEGVDAFATAVTEYTRSTGRQINHQVRLAFEEAAIRIGKIPPGFPRELLHRYIFGNYATLSLTPADFVTKVKPLASIYEPNKASRGHSNHLNMLQRDLAAKVGGGVSGSPVTFSAKYRVSAFHGAHSTAGLGNFDVAVTGTVTARALNDWEFKGTAMLVPDRWDFNWEWAKLVKELWYGGVSLDREDLRGRERRTALGRTIPGQSFYIAMTAPAQVYQKAGQPLATFSP